MLTLQDVVDKFRKYLALPSAYPVEATCAAVVANRTNGLPVWLFLVGPPSSAKTAILESTYDVDGIYKIGSLTVNTFASGYKEADDTDDDSASLLSRLKPFPTPIILHTDFTHFFSMKYDRQHEVLGQMREIYDGTFVKHTGNRKRPFVWKGKVGFLAAITEVIEVYRDLHSFLGERFIQANVPPVPQTEMAKAAINQMGKHIRIKAELAATMKTFLEQFADAKLAVASNADVEDVLMYAGILCARARTTVPRDHTGQITHMPSEEGCARLVQQLMTMASARAILDKRDTISLQDAYFATRFAVDAIPLRRAAVLKVLDQQAQPIPLTDLAVEVRLPRPTLYRIMEDLVAVRAIIDVGKAYCLEPDFAKLWAESKRGT